MQHPISRCLAELWTVGSLDLGFPPYPLFFSPSLSLSLAPHLPVHFHSFLCMGKKGNMDSLGLCILLMLLCFQWTTAPAAEEITWTYTGLVGQTEWSEYFPDCASNAQSPVEVVTTQTKYDPSLLPLTPLGYSQHGNKPFAMYNNGHTAVIELPEWMGLGGLPWLYTAVQMHLHWGSGGPSHGGGEHTVNGMSADAELHVVHYNSELYPNMSKAMTQSDGLAVLGILIVTGEETNLAFNNILNYLGRIRHADQKVFIPAFDVQTLLPEDLGRYFRYNGSLTTPPCHQSVTWTLFNERIQISPAQLLKLETILYSSKAEDPDRMLLQDNYRTTQPLNHRVVFASFSAESGRELTSGEVTAIVIGVMCGCVGLAVIIRFIVKTIRSTSSWDVLPSSRPAPTSRMKEPEEEKKQDMALNSTCEAGKKEEPSPSPQTDP
ncbi:carbonic anhydrase 14 isoform X2 [Pseudochaenichthys georgianus]|uniref:carbonic anhydrase 14 isoform X2 n=1 Tax=Pseudochaenichthys georgianus TaxID=52239 RepID=UPI00146F326B|nr:carbonic anhydrase 14 isoform X2 [Pseudochaenichthys georgianus]